MHITDVDIKVTHGQGPLLATADLIIDSDFVVHNIRIIRVSDRILVAMPSRVATAKCACGEKNPVNASFCSGCGVRLSGKAASSEGLDRQKLIPISPIPFRRQHATRLTKPCSRPTTRRSQLSPRLLRSRKFARCIAFAPNGIKSQNPPKLLADKVSPTVRREDAP